MTALCLIACLMIGLGVVKFFGKLDLGTDRRSAPTVQLSGKQ